jgi:hypothetical protein
MPVTELLGANASKTSPKTKDQDHSVPRVESEQDNSVPPVDSAQSETPATPEDMTTETLEDMATDDTYTIKSLGNHMMKMGKTLDAINENLTSLNSSVHNLEVAKDDLKEDINKLRADINLDIETTRSSFDTKLASLKSEIKEDNLIRFSEIIADLDAQKLEFTTDITTIRVNSAQDTSTITLLKETSDTHSELIRGLRAEIEIRDIKLDRLEKMLMDHIRNTDISFEQVHSYAKETREMANQIEAHERRWAIRLFGLKAPSKKPEHPHQAKEALLQFLEEKLGIKDIKPGEIDTAHRLGPITEEGNQTLLVRFFRRELVDYILSSKRMLKGKNASLFQDTTQKNRKLIFDLGKRPEVESAWCSGVSIWAKLHSRNKKIKVGITSDLDSLLAKPEKTDLLEQEHVTEEVPTSALVTHPSQTAIKQTESTQDNKVENVQNDPLLTTTVQTTEVPSIGDTTLLEYSLQSSTALLIDPPKYTATDPKVTATPSSQSTDETPSSREVEKPPTTNPEDSTKSLITEDKTGNPETAMIIK